MKNKKKKKTKLVVVPINSLPYDKMWADMWETAGIVKDEKREPGDEAVASSILSLMELIERRYTYGSQKKSS